MTHLEMIEVIKAHSEGKKIQYRKNLQYSCSFMNEWLDCLPNPSWNFDDLEYRVKPESQVRPYKNRDECWDDMQNHQPVGWLKLKTSGDYISFSSVTNLSDFDFFFKNHTYVDGSPFGIVEEE